VIVTPEAKSDDHDHIRHGDAQRAGNVLQQNWCWRQRRMKMVMQSMFLDQARAGAGFRLAEREGKTANRCSGGTSRSGGVIQSKLIKERRPGWAADRASGPSGGGRFPFDAAVAKFRLEPRCASVT